MQKEKSRIQEGLEQGLKISDLRSLRKHCYES